MVMLLKQKSKIIISQKPRKTYEVKSIFKRAKIDETVTEVKKEEITNILGFSGTGKTTKKIQATIVEKYDEEMQT